MEEWGDVGSGNTTIFSPSTFFLSIYLMYIKISFFFYIVSTLHIQHKQYKEVLVEGDNTNQFALKKRIMLVLCHFEY